MKEALARQPYLKAVETTPQESGDAAFVEIPTKPTLEMLTAGSRAGNVSVNQVWTIYQAMLKTAP